MQKKNVLELMLISMLLIVTTSVCIADAQSRGILEGMQIPDGEDMQDGHQGGMQGDHQGGMQGDHQGGTPGGYQGGMQGDHQGVIPSGQPVIMPERIHGGRQGGTPSGQPGVIPGDQPVIMPERIHGGRQGGTPGGQPGVIPGGQPVVMPSHFQPQDRFQPQDYFRRDHHQRDHNQRDHFRRDHGHYPEYWPGYWSGDYVVFGSWLWGYGPGFPIGWPIAGFLNPPGNLAVVSGYPCTIQWNDNSNNEAGFNIYVGGSCANCAATNNWNLVARVGANVETYTWVETYGESQRPVNCCDVGECSCVMVRAVRADGSESGNSNVVMLSPVC
jgi:hypothetical protein